MNDPATRNTTTESADSSCAEAVRFKLVDEAGRLRFHSVGPTGAGTCPPGAIDRLVSALDGAWLDEVDLDSLASIECAAGKACHSSIAELLRELRDLSTP